MSSFALAIETSTRQGSVAAQPLGAGAGDRTVRAALSSAQAHARDLLPAVAGLARDLGAAPGELQAVFVGTGPGSYTGLRVGVATALALARTAGAPARGVPSAEALALAALAPGEEGLFLLDARAGGFYVARYARAGDEVTVVEPPQVVARAEIAARIAGSEPILTDAATVASAELGARDVERARIQFVPRAEEVLALGLARLARLGPELFEHIRPLYLRN